LPLARIAAIRAVPAPRPAAISALEMIGSGEDEIRTLVVIVFGHERGQILRRRWRLLIHSPILSRGAKEPERW